MVGLTVLLCRFLIGNAQSAAMFYRFFVTYFCSQCWPSPPFCSFVMPLDVLNVVRLKAKIVLVYILNEDASYVNYSLHHLNSAHNVLVNGDDSL